MLRIIVIPAKVGIQNRLKIPDSGFLRNDGGHSKLLNFESSAQHQLHLQNKEISPENTGADYRLRCNRSRAGP